MPFGIGGHPAFKIDIEQLKKGNYYLEFEEKEEKITLFIFGRWINRNRICKRHISG